VFDLSVDSLGVAAPAPSVDPIVSQEFADDLDAIRDGEADDDLLEEYDLVIKEKPSLEPVVEEPGYVSAPPASQSWSSGQLLFWELFIVLAVVSLFFIVRLDIMLHRK